MLRTTRIQTKDWTYPERLEVAIRIYNKGLYYPVLKTGAIDIYKYQANDREMGFNELNLYSMSQEVA